MNAAKYLLAKVDLVFSKHLLLSNVVTCGALMGVGDALVQSMNIVQSDKQKPIKFDFPRTGRMILIGFCLGPFNHYWYAILDKVIKGTSGKAVVQKILCDQVIAGPFFCTTFLFGLSFLEGKGLEESYKEWKSKFLHIYFVDWMFWPAAQSVNFRFVPGQFRVAYVSSATLIWNSMLSYFKHSDMERYR
ncbi:mpv17-like protein 2 isoform X3 [Physella acuta]|uniref:mpv17-like protein 2 isoform X3 n=1 Tax=Physella acuta TaxID=109671 RepID=UPI0027DE1C07|nr:mpv17-like protein 2 isoform X3 [Physella acuta]